MNENPYESPATIEAKRKTRGTSWALWSGLTCLFIAALCAVLTTARMIAMFQTLSQASSPSKPEEFAEGIHIAIIPAYGIVPFGLLGIVLVSVGVVFRRRSKRIETTP